MIGEVCMAIGACAVAWCGHTPETRRAAARVSDAIDDAFPSQQAASISMGLDADGTELSKQLAGRPLNFWRLWNASPQLRIALVKHLGAEVGATVITASERDLILGFVGVGLKRMAKVVPDLFQREVS